MDSSRSSLQVSSTCGGCGYSACICYEVARKVMPAEYAPFGIYPRGVPSTETNHANGYGDPSFRFRSEVDGLQAGVNYLDTFEGSAKESPLKRIHRKPFKGSLEIEARSRNLPRTRRLEPLDKNFLRITAKDASSAPPDRDFDFGLYDSHKDQSFQDLTPSSSLDINDNSWKIATGFQDNEYDWPDLSGDLFSASNQAQEQSTDVGYGSIQIHTRERAYASQQSQQYKESKPLPIIHNVHSEEAMYVETNEPPTIAKKVPQQSQWATLRELRLSSRLHYMKFLNLTNNHESRGMKMLRKMYGSSKGMLDAGIRTFKDVLDGQEPQSLKEVFAFTCLSYVMSKLLQKHGRIEGSQVLADTNRWRLAIKKEKDRDVYDQVVKILWPEIDFLKEHSKEKDATSMPPPPESHQGFMFHPTQISNVSTEPLYVPSSMLAYCMNTSSDFSFLEKTRATDCSDIENHMQSALQGPENSLNPDNRPNDHGLHDHLVGLLQETSSHKSFMFADFLNFCEPQAENNIDTTFETQPPAVTSATYPPDRTPQIFPLNRPVGTIDPKILSNPSPLIAGSEVLVQTESLSSKADEIPTVSSLLGRLIHTIMFQVVVEFIKFVTSLGELLFHLSGCGITSRRKKHEVEGNARPVQDIGEFVTGAISLLLEPMKEDLGEADESVHAVLCMADTFVRLGCLQTVREIEDYIITTARHLVCDYTSFTTIVSKTLERCLSASHRMTWDHIYPSYAVDEEDYSSTYTKKKEATEIEWALQNLKEEDNDENNVDFTAINERNSYSASDSIPSKKQKPSPPSPNSSTEYQSSTTSTTRSSGDLSTLFKAPCHYANCKKSYTGKDARVNLRRHVRTAHEGCKTIKCPKCGHESPRRDNVRKHFLLMHKGEEMPAVLMCKTRA